VGRFRIIQKFLSNYAKYYLWKRRTLGIRVQRERGNKIQANVPLLRLRTLVGTTPRVEQVRENKVQFKRVQRLAFLHLFLPYRAIEGVLSAS